MKACWKRLCNMVPNLLAESFSKLRYNSFIADSKSLHAAHTRASSCLDEFACLVVVVQCIAIAELVAIDNLDVAEMTIVHTRTYFTYTTGVGHE